MNIFLVIEQYYDSSGDFADARSAGNPVRAFIDEDDAMRCCQELIEVAFKDMSSDQLELYLCEWESFKDIGLLVGNAKAIREAFSKHKVPLPYYEESIEVEEDENQ